jgi:hypothetical protein
MKGNNKKLEYMKGGSSMRCTGRGVIRRALKHATSRCFVSSALFLYTAKRIQIH